MEGDDVVARDGLDGVFRDRPAERMIRAVEDARKCARRHRRRLCLRLRQRDKTLSAQPFERRRRERRMLEHVREDVERLRELRRRSTRSCIRAGLGGRCRWRPLPPRSCSAFDSASPSRVVVPSLIIAAVNAALRRGGSAVSN